MSKEHQNLRDSLCELIRSLFTPTKYGTVTAVDEAKRTCSVQIGGIVREGVLLHAVIDDSKKGFCFIPKLKSKVLVSTFNDTRSYVTMFSEVDKVLLTIGEKVSATMDEKGLTLDADQITFNEGKLGGLIKIEALTSKINELVDAFNSHTHTIITGGVAVTGSPSAQANTAPITVPAVTVKHEKVKVADYENPDITH